MSKKLREYKPKSAMVWECALDDCPDWVVAGNYDMVLRERPKPLTLGDVKPGQLFMFTDDTRERHGICRKGRLMGRNQCFIDQQNYIYVHTACRPVKLWGNGHE
ncbi:MAG: hypothetical protein GY841_16535 [FCB group bacterium]|nr:hypothetical protein [FCB group bacterium]